MSRATSPVSGKPYGLATVCRVWRLARSGVYRHQAPPPDTPPSRRGPRGPMSDDDLTTAIRAVLEATPFHGEGHRKVWARLRFAGTRTSLRRVLRLMRENDLLAPGRVGSPRGPRNHDGTIIPDTVDTMWGTDLTTTFTGEGQAAVFIAVDHFTAECVGIHASSRSTRFEALEPIRQGVRDASAALPRISRTASPCGTITDRNTCRITFKRRSHSSVLKAHPPSSAPQRATAAPSGSSARSRKTCCGCGTSKPSRNYVRLCWRSARSTTRHG